MLLCLSETETVLGRKYTNHSWLTIPILPLLPLFPFQQVSLLEQFKFIALAQQTSDGSAARSAYQRPEDAGWGRPMEGIG